MRYAAALLLALACSAVVRADEPATEWDAKADLKAMQGRWKVNWQITGFRTFLGTEEAKLAGDGTGVTLSIDGNRLTQADEKTEVTLANDVPLAEEQGQVIEGNRLILVTLPDGKALLGSYKVEGDSLEFRYPHTCHCTRSGSIVRLERVKE